jgi:hypothetical protein
VLNRLRLCFQSTGIFTQDSLQGFTHPLENADSILVAECPRNLRGMMGYILPHIGNEKYVVAWKPVIVCYNVNMHRSDLYKIIIK